MDMDFHPTQGFRCLYVHDRRGKTVGLIMTHSANGTARMGWSLCRQKEDTFRKRDARKLAQERLVLIPAVELPTGLSDTPMNRALVAFAGNPETPQTIRSAARTRMEYRATTTNTSSQKLSLFNRFRLFVSRLFGF